MITIVYLVAGLSSRFNGKIKQFARIGPNNETLIELSMLQAKKAGFEKIVFVVGEKTEIPFKKKFGNNFEGIPIFYAEQKFDKETRDKPFGTVDALVSAINIVKENFVVCNGDDLYGEKSLKIAKEFLEKNDGKGCCIGFELGKVIPETGKTNRGIFEIDKKNNILGIKEFFDIEKNNLEEKNLTKKTLCSMNLFGLPKNALQLLEKKLYNFKKNNKNNRKIECLLPVELGELLREKKLELKLLSTNDDWFGVTNPEDEEIIREKIRKLN
ncbi:MAG: sugar phosphate nucleotidyltransferase [Candidatus ainarchaeum sp.]|nr:sugar phosphate nucleotidyltransferase [Candidatus ainarchaeum sp.]